MAIHLNRAAPNLAVVCVDQNQQNNFSGRYYHKYAADPFPFHSGVDLQLQLDAFFDSIRFPQSSTRVRSFGKAPEIPSMKGRSIVQETDQLLEHKGSLATFVVHVQYRQNATWQGRLVWADRKMEVGFRSALEMIKLMDQALDQSDPAENGASASESPEDTDGGKLQ